MHCQSNSLRVVRLALTSRLFSQRSASITSTSTKSYDFIKTDKRGINRNIGFIQLNRPQALNALCSGLMQEVLDALDTYECDSTIKTIVLTGTEKFFAAGADIKEMCDKPYSEVYQASLLSKWDRVAHIRKPVIAAVCGYALGGGCELAMMCDVIYASDTAKFGQPEIKLGTIPGAGGTQRLTRAVGKSRAMEIILAGEMFSAQDALAAGLVSRVYPSAEVLPKAIELAEKIGSFSGLAVCAAKEAINAAYNMTLSEGLHFEKRLFHASFATRDCSEGMNAFIQKRKPEFKDA
ncbi:unnamed protein product [Calicophoron daubneyi]|uniref:Probable enoyl-CoA hydratase, mitochondrial n=1 Tax=Calicophoron daubneyi TaxID=300641 RepID=A0AAV2TD78_CALDB